MPTSYADPLRPTAFDLLGTSLVIWKSGASWSTADDACPHRLAPLSTARVEEDGTLRCRFHGWRFDADGACVEIPNADAKTSSKLCNTEKTSAGTYPTLDVGGLLWVWPTAGDFAAAANGPQPAIDASAPPKDWIMTVSPISYESMVENAMDPSHAPFLHEGTFAASDFTPMDRYNVAEKPCKSGFTVAHGGYSTKNVGMEATRAFSAPAYVNVTYDKTDGKRQMFDLYFTPATAFSTRVITNIGLPTPPKWAPEWVFDAAHSFFFTSDALWRFNDQDRYMMMGQDRNNVKFEQLAMTTSDVGVATFRNWLSNCAAPLAFEPQLNPQPWTEASSRWHGHTKHSPQCRRTLARLDVATMVFGRGALASALVALALAAAGRAANGVAPLAVAVASYGAARWADRIRRAFFGREPEAWLTKVFTTKSSAVTSTRAR
ncbi:hypothetical protein M885DRAFT_510036 [Pelagophyceae sp. CCMP2097]|nr:hypothetical protein M885DRAFT_510036 [Pelagophyceae sp. CCMP2097]